MPELSMPGLNKQLLTQIVKLILNYKKPEKIVLFGSRAKDNFKEVSDIDIAILGKDWTDRDINIVKHTLDEYVKTPLKFDLLNFYTLTKERLKENILRKGKAIYDSRDEKEALKIYKKIKENHYRLLGDFERKAKENV